MSLKQILQNAVIYPVVIGSLFLGAYRCGDGSEPNPTEDAQVEVDTGNQDKDGGLEDKLVYPDANGDDEKLDAGYDANLTDIYDGGLDASDVDITDVPYYDGSDLTDVLDGGYDVGRDVGDGGQNLPPVVIIETKDEQGNVKDTFNVGEYVVWDLNKSYDPDCGEAGTCGSSKGMDYCDWSDDLGNAGNIYFTNYGGNGTSKIKYGTGASNKSITTTVKCSDLDDKLYTSTTTKINIK